MSSCCASGHASAWPVGRDAVRGALTDRSRRGNHSQPNNPVAPCAENNTCEALLRPGEALYARGTEAAAASAELLFLVAKAATAAWREDMPMRDKTQLIMKLVLHK